MFKRDEGVDTSVLLCDVICLVWTVCGGVVRHCNCGAGLSGHAKRSVEVFYHRVFAGAVQSVVHEERGAEIHCV